MMKKAILFDFDGTLVNSAPGIVKTMEQTFLKMGLSVPSEEDMVATIGIPLRLALKQLNNLSEEKADLATDTYRELFPLYEVNYVSVFSHVVQVLKEFKEEGLRLAIVTSRDFMSLDLICKHWGLWDYFETWVTGADGYAPKPAPDMVLALLKKMNLSPADALVVGDTTFDIEMGNAAGCQTVAVTYGNHLRERLLQATPDFLIDSFDELRKLLDD